MNDSAQSREEKRQKAMESKLFQQKNQERTIIIGALLLALFIVLILLVRGKDTTPPPEDEVDGQALGQETLTVTLLGDVSFGSNGGKRRPFDDVWMAQRPEYFTQNLADRLNASDAVVASLKNAFVPTTTDTPVEGKEGPYKAYRRDYVQFFRPARITYLNMATNHTGDYGQTGFNQTVAWLKENGVQTFGTHTMPTTNPYFGRYQTDVSQVIDKNGLKVGLLGFMGYNGAHPTAEQVKQRTDDLRNQGCAFIMAALNAGNQGVNAPATAQRTYAYLLVDNGVDLVFGSGAHIIQPKEVYKDKTIYYGLGNFFFIDYADTVTNPLSLMLEVKLDQAEDGSVQVTIDEIPIRWTGPTNRNTYQPMPATDPADLAAVEALISGRVQDPAATEEEGQDPAPQDPGIIPRVTAPGSQLQAPSTGPVQTENPDPGQPPAQNPVPVPGQADSPSETENPHQAQPATLKIPRIKANHAFIPADDQGDSEKSDQ